MQSFTVAVGVLGALATQVLGATSPSTTNWSKTPRCMTNPFGSILPISHFAPKNLTVLGCLNACSKYQNKYAAIQNGTTCFCGNTLNTTKDGRPIIATLCSSKCIGDNSVGCGGTHTVDLYERPGAFNATTFSKPVTSTSSHQSSTSSIRLTTSSSTKASSTSTSSSRPATSSSTHSSSTTKTSSSTTSSKSSSSSSSSKTSTSSSSRVVTSSTSAKTSSSSSTRTSSSSSTSSLKSSSSSASSKTSSQSTTKTSSSSSKTTSTTSTKPSTTTHSSSTSKSSSTTSTSSTRSSSSSKTSSTSSTSKTSSSSSQVKTSTSTSSRSSSSSSQSSSKTSSSSSKISSSTSSSSIKTSSSTSSSSSKTSSSTSSSSSKTSSSTSSSSKTSSSTSSSSTKASSSTSSSSTKASSSTSSSSTKISSSTSSSSSKPSSTSTSSSTPKPTSTSTSTSKPASSSSSSSTPKPTSTSTSSSKASTTSTSTTSSLKTSSSSTSSTRSSSSSSTSSTTARSSTTSSSTTSSTSSKPTSTSSSGSSTSSTLSSSSSPSVRPSSSTTVSSTTVRPSTTSSSTSSSRSSSSSVVSSTTTRSSSSSSSSSIKPSTTSTSSSSPVRSSTLPPSTSTSTTTIKSSSSSTSSSTSTSASASSTNTPLPSGWALNALCVRDNNPPNRLLANQISVPNLTINACINACNAKGYTYAGVEFGIACACDNTLNTAGGSGQSLYPLQSCNSACAGAPNVTCGGSNAMKLYYKTPPTTSNYRLVETHQGATFFNNYKFYTGGDPTSASIKYVGLKQATNQGMIYYQNDGAVVINVDNKTVLPAGVYRNSTRIVSKTAYDNGLWVVDLQNMPYGCSVWPSLWTLGPKWPSTGEIDIIEGVNTRVVNQMAFHTNDTKCTTNMVKNTDVQAGIGQRTCYSTQSAGTGCGFDEVDSSSYGPGFSKAGGSVFAMAVESDGIFIWRFPRARIPDDITNGKPNPSGWGRPVAAWPSSSDCPTSTHVSQQQLIFNTALCGGWAAPAFKGDGCPGTCADYIRNPANFPTAAWVINYVKIYQQ